MRKRSTLRTQGLAVVFTASLMGAQAARGSETPLPVPAEASTTGSAATGSKETPRPEVARMQALVDGGSLPPNSIEEAKAKLADADDERILTQTLYLASSINMEQQALMVDAAQRRYDRQAQLVTERERLLSMGVIAQSELDAAQQELSLRSRELSLAHERRVLEAQRETLFAERSLERAIGSTGANWAMMKFEGSGEFHMRYLPELSAAFEQEFGHPLPVTARGETALHASLGFDHRGKIDVGLNPEEPEGIWLRRWLEERQIPYIAFRCAVPGSATAAHIHIGSGSTRLASSMSFRLRSQLATR